MNYSSSLLSRTAALSSGTAIFMVGQLLYVMLLARLGSPLLVGAYALATAILNPIFFFSRMGIRTAQATETATGISFRTYRNLQYYLSVFALLLTLVIMGFLDQSPVVNFVIIVVLFAKLVETLCDLHYGLFLQHDRHQVIATSLTLRSVASVVVFLIIFNSYGAEAAVVALPLSWAFVFVLHDLVRSRSLRSMENTRRVSTLDLRALMWLLLPLAVSGFLGQLGLSVPRYVIDLGAGTIILGQVAPALMAHVFVSAFADSVSQSLLPTVARELVAKNSKEAWNRLVSVAVKLLPLVLCGIVTAFLFGPFLIDLVFGSGFELAGEYLGIVSLSWSFRAYGTLFAAMVLGSRRFPVMLWVNSSSFAAYTIPTIGLWQFFGLPGTIWGIVIGSLFYCFLMILFARRSLLT